jgi:myo-inositol 2-dehydrogenase/D-chiro-inositol 1-dehydrogenase
MSSTRRDFIKQTGSAGVLISTPYFLTSRAIGAVAAGSQPTVASIGVGGSRGRYNQGGYIGRKAAQFGRTIAVCDVDALHTEEFSAWSQEKHGHKLNQYGDYRELLAKEKPDIVTIGTPDHWHVPIAIEALRAGCDVYCEKPLTLTIAEGIQICKVVEETGRVFQVGTQQRSENDARFLKAIAIVQSGRLGKNVNAYVAIGDAPDEGPFAAQEVPDGLDWDRWVGPAPKVDYLEQRRRMFRWWFEYSGGKMTDWGAHHIDIAQWALGHEKTGPIEVSAQGAFPNLVPDGFSWKPFLDGETTLPNGYNTATHFCIDLKFANGSIINVNDTYRRNDEKTEFGNGILFEGENGRIFVNRSKLTGKPVEELSADDNRELEEQIVKLYRGRQPGNHMGNFFASVADRQQPISDVYTHHRIMTSCHLCNLTLMLGRTLHWDPQRQTFPSDSEATALMTRKRRAGFELEV